ncbi:MAG: hypothetical protein K8L99_02485 [Anaerolineae bacterium]|nr:hypothetical protein [Anaerolineae bacterium]
MYVFLPNAQGEHLAGAQFKVIEQRGSEIEVERERDGAVFVFDTVDVEALIFDPNSFNSIMRYIFARTLGRLPDKVQGPEAMKQTQSQIQPLRRRLEQAYNSQSKIEIALQSLAQYAAQLIDEGKRPAQICRMSNKALLAGARPIDDERSKDAETALEALLKRKGFLNRA